MVQLNGVWIYGASTLIALMAAGLEWESKEMLACTIAAFGFAYASEYIGAMTQLDLNNGHAVRWKPLVQLGCSILSISLAVISFYTFVSL